MSKNPAAGRAQAAARNVSRKVTARKVAVKKRAAEEKAAAKRTAARKPGRHSVSAPRPPAAGTLGVSILIENAADAFTKTAKDKRKRAVRAVGLAESRLRLAGHREAENVLSGLLGFFGDTTGAKFAKARKVIADLAGGEDRVKYREPGEPPIELEGMNARVFVLGPPRDREAIKRSAPRKGTEEVYFGAYGKDLDVIELAFENQGNAPFGSRFAIPLAENEDHRLLPRNLVGGPRRRQRLARRHHAVLAPHRQRLAGLGDRARPEARRGHQ